MDRHVYFACSSCFILLSAVRKIGTASNISQLLSKRNEHKQCFILQGLQCKKWLFPENLQFQHYWLVTPSLFLKILMFFLFTIYLRFSLSVPRAQNGRNTSALVFATDYFFSRRRRRSGSYVNNIAKMTI